MHAAYARRKVVEETNVTRYVVMLADHDGRMHLAALAMIRQVHARGQTYYYHIVYSVTHHDPCPLDRIGASDQRLSVDAQFTFVRAGDQLLATTGSDCARRSHGSSELQAPQLEVTASCTPARSTGVGGG